MTDEHAEFINPRCDHIFSTLWIVLSIILNEHILLSDTVVFLWLCTWLLLYRSTNCVYLYISNVYGQTQGPSLEFGCCPTLARHMHKKSGPYIPEIGSMAAGKVGHGAGIRHLVDIGVLLQPPTYANWTYIRAQSLQFPCSECIYRFIMLRVQFFFMQQEEIAPLLIRK